MDGKLPLILLLSFGAMFTTVWLLLTRKRLNMAWYAAVPIAVLHTIYGVLTVKAFAFLEAGLDTERLGAMSLFGGVFLMPLAYWLGARLTKRSTKEVFDIFTPCMIFTVMCARVNCIISGCCRGVFVPGLNGIRFPTRELEIIFYMLLLLWLCPRIARGSTQGRGYPIYMIGYGGFRFIVEFFRDAGTEALFHKGHLWAMITLLLGISIYAEINVKNPKRKRRDGT